MRSLQRSITFLVALICAAATYGESPRTRTRIGLSPAFNAAQLTAPPRDAWITNGGNVFNQRYAPLAGIHRDNVGKLRAVWRTHLDGSGAANRNSGQAQALFYQGALYTITGDNDVFALEVETGAVLWKHAGQPHPRSGVAFGWSNRGVAMGEGKIFYGQIDAKLVALDQRTGKPVWSTQAERWQDGYSITSAPLYHDGLVIVGFSGGELGIRGCVKAFDAKTGKLRWTFYTVPGPGEFGHDTWPQDSDFWKHGGAPVWQTPAVDPKLGLIYFSTGNPAPDFNGAVRAGDNLFSSSIVALEARTGRYRWHFQEVHHDIWDYDAPNPVILFDMELDGQPRQALVQVGKTGWAYILDRRTGKPLLGIDERPVPQEPRQKTAPTQPYPVGDAIVPQFVDIAPEGYRLVNDGKIFTPFWTEAVVMKPASMGGANWPPSAYDPETHHLYVCATDRIQTFEGGNRDNELPKPSENGAPVFMGGRLGQTSASDRGIFAAVDMRTNKLVWRQQWRDICYSGALVTAGGLVFVGRNDGRFMALDKRDGAKLWEFQTDAGVNAPASTFEYKGTQYIAVFSGGAVFAGSRRGDSVWLFSLEGKLGPTSPIAAAPAPRASAQSTALATPNAANGREIYRQSCAPCHGANGQGGTGGGAALHAARLGTLDAVAALIAAGRNNMPGYASTLSAQQVRDVSAYVLEALK